MEPALCRDGTTALRVPEAVNFHLYKACNLRCRFCFATFRDVRGRLPRQQALELVHTLAGAGFRKITFVGGEPTLHPHLGELLELAHRSGLTTCIVTNGARLDTVLDQHAAHIDWVGLSVDSANEEIQRSLGRGDGQHVARSLELAAKVRALGIRLKLNTVVTSENCHEDMSELVRAMAPDRWKAFQVLPVDGQNDGSVESLLISEAAFHDWLARHRHLRLEGLGPVAEDNEAMRGSYAMIDPRGRFFGNATGSHVYSAPILEVGVPAALASVGFEYRRFEQRGGLYPW